MKYYYGYIFDGYGFVAEGDERIKPDFIELEESYVDEMLQECKSNNVEVVCFNGEVFTSEPDYYFADENHQWQKRTQAEVEEIRRQRREEHIVKLSLTKREVFLALYADKGITPEQIRAQITDPAALIEFDYAERYYRGNVLIDLIGQKLGYTKQQLDNLFENGSF